MKSALAIVVVWALAVIGQIANIVWLFREGATASTHEFALALVGLPLFPIGIIHGWLYML